MIINNKIKKAAYLMGFIGFSLASQPLLAQKAKVKSLEFQQREIKEEIQKDSLLTTKKELKEYDEQGRLILQKIFVANPIGQLTPKKEVKKTFEGRILRIEEQTEYDEMGDPLKMEQSHYNDDKDIVKLEYIDYLKAPDTRYTKEYEYDEYGLLDKTLLKNEAGKKVGEERWKYNADDEIIKYTKWEKLPSGKKYKESEKTEYDENGFLASSEKEIDDGQDKYKEITTFVRNRVEEQLKYKNGELISEFGGAKKGGFDPSKARVMMTFNNDGGGLGGGGGFGGGGFGRWANEDEYDDKGNKTKTIQKVDDVVTQITFYSYDERNNLISSKKVDYEGEKETRVEEEVQEFDDNNNMLRRAVYVDGQIISEKRYNYQYR